MYVSSDVELKYYISNNGSLLDEEIKDIEGILIEEGNNFIIAILKKGDVTNRYKFVIYRKMRYTMTFDTPTQEVKPQIIVEINFAGTIRQFVGIDIGHAWNASNHEITIHCTDGDLTSFVTSY